MAMFPPGFRSRRIPPRRTAIAGIPAANANHTPLCARAQAFFSCGREICARRYAETFDTNRNASRNANRAPCSCAKARRAAGPRRRLPGGELQFAAFSGMFG